MVEINKQRVSSPMIRRNNKIESKQRSPLQNFTGTELHIYFEKLWKTVVLYQKQWDFIKKTKPIELGFGKVKL